MKKLKVAVVIPTHFDMHSSLANLLKVYGFLIKNRDVEVTIFTDKKNNVKYGDFKIEKISGIDYRTILEKILFVLGIPRFWYADLVGKLKGYDVIESSNPEFYGFAYQSYRAARKYNARLIYRTSQTVDGFFLFRLTRLLVAPIARKAYGYASSLLFTNPQAEERAIRLGLINHSKKSIIIGHATDTRTFRPLNLKKDKSKIVLLSVGGLYKIKGHHIIIKALKRLIDKGHKNAELWIVGDGYYKGSLERLSKALDVSKNVKFLGKKGHDDLAKIYNLSDIFVLANFQEMTPAVNEAMACQVPVVVMECGGRDFVIPDESCGLVSKKLDVGDMAEKIEFLIKNKKAAARMAEKGGKRILDNFSVDIVAERIYSAFVKN
ncbi:glycosyltransferase family 4 protein [Candidatus Woesearchaeota archaeon]|nr:glycosyltransferase family 4 protein [Candidatus Woesearchaeota archaeon]